MSAKKGRACVHFGNFVKWGNVETAGNQVSEQFLLKQQQKNQNLILLLSELKVLCVSKEYV